jgi:hypothetical protein
MSILSVELSKLNFLQLSDFLEYQNAQVALINDKSLNSLVKETRDENTKMRSLTVSAVSATCVSVPSSKYL